MDRKLTFYCGRCDNEVLDKERFYSGVNVCECEQKYADEIYQQQEEFLRKEEPYLYE